MAFLIAPRAPRDPHLPDLRTFTATTDRPLSLVLADADHRSGAPRQFRVWYHDRAAWFEIKRPEFRQVGADRWEAVGGVLRLAVERRPDGWHAYGWSDGRQDWHPAPFPFRASAEAWCIDSYGRHEVGDAVSAGTDA